MLSYPGLHIEIWVPADHDDRETYSALRKLRRKVRTLAKAMLRKGVRVTLDRRASLRQEDYADRETAQSRQKWIDARVRADLGNIVN
jgi:hypothetical protein